MNDKSLGIYVHIPFCERKCKYCDFLSFNADDKKKEDYVEALISEIGSSKYAGNEVDTIFFGGGTPSVLSADQIVRIFEKIKESFDIDEDAEITIECNPGTVDRDKLFAYKNAGFNRISFGLQSVHEGELKMLGRIHGMDDFKESFFLARGAGFENINIDLMMGLPGQTVAVLTDTLRTVEDMNPEHISLYSLILEDGTPLEKEIDALTPLPYEEEERKMYHDAVKELESRGYFRYEISNFAVKKDGRDFSCRHNLKYWNMEDYLGFGIGAASFTGGERFSNTREFGEYVGETGVGQGDSSVVHAGREPQNRPLGSHMSEFMFLGLRKTRGIKKADFKDLFGKDLDEVFGDIIKEHIQDGTMREVDGGYALTDRGIDVSNYILADFI